MSEFEVKDSGERHEFGGGMVRDTAEGKIDYTLVFDGVMLERWAEHLTKGAVKYDARNWMLGIEAQDPDVKERFRQSATRHFIQWLRGDRDEDHAAAVFFNMNGFETFDAGLPSFIEELEDCIDYLFAEDDDFLISPEEEISWEVGPPEKVFGSLLDETLKAYVDAGVEESRERGRALDQAKGPVKFTLYTNDDQVTMVRDRTEQRVRENVWVRDNGGALEIVRGCIKDDPMVPELCRCRECR